MTAEQIAAEHHVWGAPQPSPRRWGLRETAAAVGVAAVIAALGGATIYAATEGSSHSIGAPHQAFGPGGGSGGPGGPGGQHGVVGGPGPAAVGSTSLHGEFVEPDGANGYTTVLTQTGTVTAISPTSITVRSEDGYSQTYVMTRRVQARRSPWTTRWSSARHATVRPRRSPTSVTRRRADQTGRSAGR